MGGHLIDTRVADVRVPIFHVRIEPVVDALSGFELNIAFKAGGTMQDKLPIFFKRKTMERRHGLRRSRHKRQNHDNRREKCQQSLHDLRILQFMSKSLIYRPAGLYCPMTGSFGTAGSPTRYTVPVKVCS